MPQAQNLLTTAEFAKKSGMSTAQVSKLIRDGKIKATKLSGRWRIDPDQLNALAPRKSGRRSPAKKETASPRAENNAQNKTASSREAFSVADFAAMTYLTQKGIIDWLKSGRLKGQMDSNGQWTVDAVNLQVADIKRLVRE